MYLDPPPQKCYGPPPKKMVCNFWLTEKRRKNGPPLKIFLLASFLRINFFTAEENIFDRKKKRKTVWTPLKNVTAKNKWYWCFYPHWARDSLSPICRNFFWKCLRSF